MSYRVWIFLIFLESFRKDKSNLFLNFVCFDWLNIYSVYYSILWNLVLRYYIELVKSFKFYDDKVLIIYNFMFFFFFKIGKSKGYVFVEFYLDEVVKVVVDIMDNYLVFERIVKCKLKFFE